MNNQENKELNEDNSFVNKRHLLVILISSILITFIYLFQIEGYFFDTMLPFIIILCSYLIIFKDFVKNKKSYYLLIPIILIVISDVVVGIDASNKELNIIILPILLSIMLFSLLNKNYKLTGNFITWLFKLFPKGLLSNLKYLKIKSKNPNYQKIGKLIIGIILGILFASVILSLLVKADDYFNAFINNFFDHLYKFDINYLVILIISFVFIFSLYINISKNINTKMNEVKKYNYDVTTVTTFLIIVNSVFVLFIISEISRLTNNFLAIPIEYTYSSYAREGFFQLLIITIINYMILMVIIYKTNLCHNQKIRWLLLALVIFSVILIFNSYYRMYLYINHFGFTILRMQVILFLLMELIIFILMIIKLFDRFKNNNSFVYFVVIICFYIVNLYLCNDWFINIINN